MLKIPGTACALILLSPQLFACAGSGSNRPVAHAKPYPAVRRNSSQRSTSQNDQRPTAVPTAPPSEPTVSNCPAVDAALIVATIRGDATYYSDKLKGHRTASGEPYDPEGLTAAHRTLPLGSLVRVERIDDASRFVCVRITDRGPFGSRKRVIDLSKAAARRLNMLRAGVIAVQIDVLTPIRP